MNAGISLRKAAKMIGVAEWTLRLYETDQSSLKTASKRDACAAFYERLRRFLGEQGAA